MYRPSAPCASLSFDAEAWASALAARARGGSGSLRDSWKAPSLSGHRTMIPLFCGGSAARAGLRPNGRGRRRLKGPDEARVGARAGRGSQVPEQIAVRGVMVELVVVVRVAAGVIVGVAGGAVVGAPQS